ncbi:MAG TPA: exodeoxyribonuclease VII large subunit [Stellaceae bacterium]|jgi:exodeoxyribonuclease VII large subunit|nr:exodeoxyribonuclease VII large subunit [Stellaceae bacterium]
MTESTVLAPGAADPSRLNLPEYTVSELSAAVKRSLEQGFSYVRVRGEVSGFKRHGSGHCYLSLKDADAVLDAVIWRMTAQRMSLKPEDGLEVLCTGRITTYANRSKYQLVIESIELAGVGALLKMLEDRRKRLAAEGLFDASRKRPLPYLPEVIGVVTSPTGAVIRDILHRLAERFPRRVLLWPVAVQGEGAAEQVAAAIDGFNRLPEAGPVPRPDLIIVARGGGSLEDLMAFNEEIVVRAAAASLIPLISAVGHETDTTLIDHASDRRAPTPTAAAEIAVPVRLELLSQASNAGGRMAGAMARLLDERRLRVSGLGRGLPDPRSLLEAAAQRLDDRAERLGNGLQQFLRVKRDRLSALGDRVRPEALRQQLRQAGERLAALPERMAHAMRRALERELQRIHALEGRLESHRQAIRNVLARGYVLVWGPDGKVVVSADAIPSGARLGLQFHDGKAEVVAEGPRKRKPKLPGDSPQGELL